MRNSGRSAVWHISQRCSCCASAAEPARDEPARAGLAVRDGWLPNVGQQLHRSVAQAHLALEQKGDLGEDIAAVRVLGRKLDCPVELYDGPTARRRRKQVHSDERRTRESRGHNGERRRVARWLSYRSPDGAQADVGAPLAGGCDPVDGSDDASRCDDDPKGVALRLDELLNEGAVTEVPRLLADAYESVHVHVLVVAPPYLTTPTSEAGLHHHWGVEGRRRASVTNVCGRRVRYIVASEHPRGEELVVCSEKCRRVVQNAHSPCAQGAECPEPIVDSVESGQDVEASQRAVTRLQHLERFGRAHPLPAVSADQRARECVVRRRIAAREQCKSHGLSA